MIFESVCVGPMQVNCYILAYCSDGPSIIIDPGDDEYKIRGVLGKYNLKPGIIVNTHGHIDHIGCDDKFGVPIFVHTKDSALLMDPALNLSNFLARSFKVSSEIMTVEDNESIELVQIELKVMHVPGHTPGGIALLMKRPKDKILFTGDTLFYRGVGRTDFYGASEELLLSSIREKLLTLDDDTVIYPGHGPSSTVGDEKKNNPFFV